MKRKTVTAASSSALLTRCNYDVFVPAKFEPWIRFEASPPLGIAAPSKLP